MTDTSHPTPDPQSQAPTWIPVAPPEQPAPRRRRFSTRTRIAAAVTGAFLVGCAAAGSTAAIVSQHGSGLSTEAGTASNGYSQTLQNYGNGSSQGTDGGSSGGFGGSSPFSQFGDFSQFGLSDPSLGGSTGQAGQGATADTTSDASATQSKGIVEITSTLNGGEAKGTGMILTSSGVVVTNHHVVAGATSVKVTDVSTGKTYDATYVGGDATSDIAVLRLTDASGLTPVTFANSAAATGDEITSVGDAGGDGGSLTASPGTVSALGQTITVSEDDGSTATLSNLMQLDAYIVPGDSGGAVLDSSGDVVGMNVAASGDSTAVVGYSIPASTVESTVSQILAGSSSSQLTYGYTGYLGVGLAAASSYSGSLAAAGATVAEVQSGQAAAKAGIVAGDVITGFDSTTVGSASQLQEVVAATKPGESVKVTWTTTSGATRSATVTLGTGAIA